ncbi:hypothetical protein BN14_12202 [Rhizoctonia solani AG-1 IB]|uniref:Uncharacterized protein n=1 Tax=Thanatephorus cucumeris (strain AG1-IB / isolate 7/3/14) TaxID=1108050 RepID=M5CFA9_THACB|nr:hypothetical protein BN14_12202 [Rhizoctonia solani AG-1 IB]
MFYEGDDDILSTEQIAELTEQGFYPAIPDENELDRQSLSPYELDGETLTAEELAQIDAIANSDTNAPSTTPLIGPLTLVDTFREVTKSRVGFYPHPWQVDIAVALYMLYKNPICLGALRSGTGFPPN